MPAPIVRFNDGPLQTVVFASTDAGTQGFNLAIFSGAIIMVESLAGGATTLTWKCKSHPGDSTVFAAADATNTPLQTSIAAGRAYAVPDELFAANYVLATTDAGTATCRVIVKG